MRMHQRATTLYRQLFHHAPNFEVPEEADQYFLLEKALREVAHDCKTVAEQYASGGSQGLWGEGLRQGANKIAFAIHRDVG